jgi:DNA-binding CsgD family transcriptional regulator
MGQAELDTTIDRIRATLGSLRTVRSEGDLDHQADHERLFSTLPLFPDQFMYVVDHAAMEVIRVRGFGNILGYSDADLNLEFITDLWHPEDAETMERITAVELQTMAEVRPPLQPFETSLLVDYRIRKANGDHIKVLRQTSVFELDERTGKPRSTLSICRDISRIKSSRTICWQYTGRGAEVFRRRLARQRATWAKLPTDHETGDRRSSALVVEGQCQQAHLAKELGITLNTVNTHRRNILERIGLKNTAELVRMAVEQGWV